MKPYSQDLRDHVVATLDTQQDTQAGALNSSASPAPPLKMVGALASGRESCPHAADKKGRHHPPTEWAEGEAGWANRASVHTADANAVITCNRIAG